MTGPNFGGLKGPLAPFETGFRLELVRLGFVKNGVNDQLRLMGLVSVWLDRQQLDAAGFDELAGRAFVAERGLVSRRPVSVRVLSDYLRRLGVVPVPAVPVLGPLDTMLEAYRRYLLRERGLCAGSAYVYVEAVRPFIAGRLRGDRVDVADITGADVLAFLAAVCPGKGRGRAASTATSLRSLLRWWYLNGSIETLLSGAVPTVASWRLDRLVEPLEDTDVDRLLRSCERGPRAGRRDYAVLVLLSRLGLRAGEVARLRLDDIDWHAGEILVRGKGPKEERLPLPWDVGEAIAVYLRDERPADAVDRCVFVRVRAPRGGLGSGGVSHVVLAASKRSGLGAVFAHRLRHSAATSMLRGGASLTDVGQVLRHERLATTAVYAKVDREALRTIARVWPGGAS